MSGDPKDGCPSERLVRTVTESIGPAAVDCATWDADIPAEQWSSGKFAGVTGSQPAIEGTFRTADSLVLELAFQIEADVKPARAFALAAQMLAKAISCDLELGLTFQPVRVPTDSGQVMIALAPLLARAPDSSEARLTRVAETIRQAAGAMGGVALHGVRLLRAA